MLQSGLVDPSDLLGHPSTHQQLESGAILAKANPSQTVGRGESGNIGGARVRSRWRRPGDRTIGS